MARYDSDSVDPGDIYPEDIEFLPLGTQKELFSKDIVTSITQRAANSMDRRDGHVTINSQWLYDDYALRHSLSSD